MFNAMFALSSRFSHSGFFSGTSVKQRGAVFAQQVSMIYFDVLQDADTKPTLTQFKAILLLAFYHVTDGAGPSAWLLTGLCCRLVQQLKLSMLDHDIIGSTQPGQDDACVSDDWVERESARRAWWSLWELDLFISNMSDRPPALARGQIHVLLPVSDQHWFAETPVASAPLRCDPDSAWKSLYGSTNQDERAWFLVSRHLLWLSFRSVPETKSAIDLAVSCFTMGLPDTFRLRHRAKLAFNNEHFAQSNWVVSTHLMLQAYVLQPKTSKILVGTNSSSTRARYHLHGESNLSGNIHLDVEFDNTHLASKERNDGAEQDPHQVGDLARMCATWPPEYIPLAMPIVACLIIGPSGTNIISAASTPNQNVRDILQLTLSHFSKYWDLATLALGEFSEIGRQCILLSRARVDRSSRHSAISRLCVHCRATTCL